MHKQLQAMLYNTADPGMLCTDEETMLRFAIMQYSDPSTFGNFPAYKAHSCPPIKEGTTYDELLAHFLGGPVYGFIDGSYDLPSSINFLGLRLNGSPVIVIPNTYRMSRSGFLRCRERKTISSFRIFVRASHHPRSEITDGGLRSMAACRHNMRMHDTLTEEELNKFYFSYDAPVVELVHIDREHP